MDVYALEECGEEQPLFHLLREREPAFQLPREVRAFLPLYCSAPFLAFFFRADRAARSKQSSSPQRENRGAPYSIPESVKWHNGSSLTLCIVFYVTSICYMGRSLEKVCTTARSYL